MQEMPPPPSEECQRGGGGGPASYQRSPLARLLPAGRRTRGLLRRARARTLGTATPGQGGAHATAGDFDMAKQKQEQRKGALRGRTRSVHFAAHPTVSTVTTGDSQIVQQQQRVEVGVDQKGGDTAANPPRSNSFVQSLRAKLRKSSTSSKSHQDFLCALLVALLWCLAKVCYLYTEKTPDCFGCQSFLSYIKRQ